MNPYGPPVQPIPDRIRRFVQPEPNSGCWLWIGSQNWGGYGVMRVAGKTVPAHRVSYSTFVGPIPEGLDLDHLCRVRCCVNPDHLEPVTRLVNVRRGRLALPTRFVGGRCKRGHEMTNENTAKGNRCRECARDRLRKWQKKNSQRPNAVA